MPVKTTIIFFGDVVGSLGRQALNKMATVWKTKYQADVLIANIENLAHGKGVTDKTLKEVQNTGIQIFTGGNHIWSKSDLHELADTTDFKIAAPANDSRTPQKYLYQTIDLVGQKLTVINLVGRTFIEDETLSNPFLAIDKLLEKIAKDSLVVVDMHAEATSEKMAMGFYLDGRVSAILGTHTHVPTADAQILAKGTGYITDIGMVGPYPSVLGIKQDIIIQKFLTDDKIRHELPDSGQIEVNAVLLEIDNRTKKTTRLELLREIIDQ